MAEFNESEINTAEKETLHENNPEWSEVFSRAYENLPAEFKSATQNLKDSSELTSVDIIYLPFAGPPIGTCRVTIYTATGARHPIEAKVQQTSMDGSWKDLGKQYVNNFEVGTGWSSLPVATRFSFECPAPAQYWEIHIQPPEYSPLPNFLDSMIGSCENRYFTIQYPGIIYRKEVR